MISCSSLRRSSGIVATTMHPALATASQQATIIGVFGAAQEHAIAADEAEILDQHAADARRPSPASSP